MDTDVENSSLPNDLVEVRYHGTDPNGKIGRAGRGVYYKLSEDDHWVGRWMSFDDCWLEATQALASREHKIAANDLKQAGFSFVAASSNVQRFAQKRDDQLIFFDIQPGLIHAKLRLPDGEVSDIIRLGYASGKDVHGHLRSVVRATLEFIENTFEVEPTVTLIPGSV